MSLPATPTRIAGTYRNVWKHMEIYGVRFMREVQVSTEVFARIWALRGPGEETEDAVLRRVLCHESEEDSNGSAVHRRVDADGVLDDRHGTHFPEGFEVFRNYLGHDYRARAAKGAWVLDGVQGRF